MSYKYSFLKLDKSLNLASLHARFRVLSLSELQNSSLKMQNLPKIPLKLAPKTMKKTVNNKENLCQNDAFYERENVKNIENESEYKIPDNILQNSNKIPHIEKKQLKGSLKKISCFLNEQPIEKLLDLSEKCSVKCRKLHKKITGRNMIILRRNESMGSLRNEKYEEKMKSNKELGEKICDFSLKLRKNDSKISKISCTISEYKDKICRKSKKFYNKKISFGKKLNKSNSNLDEFKVTPGGAVIYFNSILRKKPIHDYLYYSKYILY